MTSVNLDQALALQGSRKDKISGGAPKDFSPGMEFAGGRVSTITTPPVAALPDGSDYSAITDLMGVTLAENARLELVEARFDPVAWTREIPHDNDGVPTPATTKPAWRYKFRVVYDEALLPDLDLAALFREARRGRGKAALPKRANETKVVALGDIQAGKGQDTRGGTIELVARLNHALARVVAETKQQKPVELILADLGDIIEGFESAPGADRTNDMSHTQQIRFARRLLFEWVCALAPLVERLIVLGVPSNHCAVRRGKQYLSTPDDDYGLENIHAVADICAANPERFGHVQFMVPQTGRLTVTVKTIGGKILMFSHGDQKTNPNQLRTYLAEQALGRTDAGQFDIAFFGHWHHLRMQTIGDDRWFVIVPTMDAGSEWYSNSSGEYSRPGVLTMLVDADGWHDMRIAWSS